MINEISNEYASKPLNCPCCLQGMSHRSILSGIFQCACCGHSFRVSTGTEPPLHYGDHFGRNDMPQHSLTRKFHERVLSVLPILKPHLRIAEIGCAEGDFGLQLKKQVHSLEYWGVEPSQDASLAAKHLDHVVCSSRALLDSCGPNSFDIILAFHVLEHIADLCTELQNWRTLLRQDGRAVLDVPNKSGNPLVSEDRNIEHLHCFSPASLSIIMHRHDFDTISMTTGHYESPAYTDSIRVFLTPSVSPSAKDSIFLDKIRHKIRGPFSIFGVGGDFRSYLLPAFPNLQILSLIDNNEELHGSEICSKEVQGYKSEIHRGHSILIGSIKYERQIADTLETQMHPGSTIYNLSSMLDS